MEKFDLYGSPVKHQGIVMGYSAGAVIQLAEYHLSPDEDYPDFKYERGIPYSNDFYLEGRYEGTPEQNASIGGADRAGENSIRYCTQRGACLIDNGKLTLLGDVRSFPQGAHTL